MEDSDDEFGRRGLRRRGLCPLAPGRTCVCEGGGLRVDAAPRRARSRTGGRRQGPPRLGADPFCVDATGMTPLTPRGLRTDRARLDWFDIDKYKRGADGMPLPGQARREKAALNVIFDRYLTVRWKQTIDLTFARLPDHATGDEYLARHLGSFLIGDILPRKEEDAQDAGPSVATAPAAGGDE